MASLVNQSLLNYVLFGRATTSLHFRGSWNAETNTPVLRSYRGARNSYYVVSVAGNTELNGISEWQIGDWVLFDGKTWTRVPAGQQPPSDSTPPPPPSPPGPLFYVHIQETPDTVWHVHHNLGKFPDVAITRDDGVIIFALVTNVNPNYLTIKFSEPVAGTAHCD